ncbi:Gag-Pol polyprotein [Merluccius polli]|uniref:Gag-Pol polyprotein n=1 Tax=Merluccius polli TaxID=89951 RepID=A0AA47MVC5_MERPO|nr:Gag-Pol polyprotein [Merluccius polli]
MPVASPTEDDVARMQEKAGVYEHNMWLKRGAEKNRVPEPEDDPPRGVEPGDQVYLRVFRRKWNEPRREGPYKVTNATPTAIQVEGSSTWYHLNHCTKAAQPRTSQERGEETDAAAPETGSQLHDQTRLSQDEEGADAVPDPLRPGANPTGPRTDPRV